MKASLKLLDLMINDELPPDGGDEVPALGDNLSPTPKDTSLFPEKTCQGVTAEIAKLSGRSREGAGSLSLPLLAWNNSGPQLVGNLPAPLVKPLLIPVVRARV